MDIGRPKRIIEVEPLSLPLPEDVPELVPEPLAPEPLAPEPLEPEPLVPDPAEPDP